MPHRFVQVELEPPVASVILNRPDKHQALSRELLRELSAIWEDLQGKPEVRTILLRSTGPSFCAGMDLEEMHETMQRADASQQWFADAELFRETLLLMLRHPCPIVSCVEGACLGGGVALLTAGDLVVANRSSKFCVPAPRRGIVAGLVAPLLAFRTSPGFATRLLLTAETIDGAEAHRMGLVHYLTDDDQVVPRARELASEFTHSAPEAINLTKRLLTETIGEHLVSQLAAGSAMTAASQTTAAAAERLSAFAERHPSSSASLGPRRPSS